MFSFQREVKQRLRHNLSRLPRPKNDYEIVVPEAPGQTTDDDQMDTSEQRDEDQADIDQRRREAKRREGSIERKENKTLIFQLNFFSDEERFKRQTQVVQRNLPRPLDINLTVLRPANAEGPMTDLQKVTMKIYFHFEFDLFFIIVFRQKN